MKKKPVKKGSSPKKSYSMLIQLIVGLVISAVFIFITFRTLDFGKIWQSLLSANWFVVLIAVVVQIAALALRGIRWGYLIPVNAKIRTSTLIEATYIGYMANNIFPAKLGEIIRPYLLGKKEGISKTSAFASIVMERIIDGLTVVGILFVISFISPEILRNTKEALSLVASFLGMKSAPAIDVRKVTTVGFLAVLALLGFMIFLRVGRSTAFGVVSFFLKPLPKKFSEKVIAVLHKFVDGIGFKPAPGSVPIMTGITVIYWILISASLMILLFAFPFGRALPSPYLAALWVMCISGLGLSIPSAPSGIGTYEFAAIFGLVLCGIVPEDAASVAILAHFVIGLIPQVIAGFICLGISGVSFSEATKG
ncbi:MAG: lysylphosphatidylglycerol synthase transmembrane domain-containing protein [Spirochaetota bacterium]